MPIVSAVEALLTQSARWIARSRELREQAGDLRRTSRSLRGCASRRCGIAGASDAPAKDPCEAAAGSRRPAPTAHQRAAAFLRERPSERFCARCIGKHIGSQRPHVVIALLEGSSRFAVVHDICSGCAQYRVVASSREA